MSRIYDWQKRHWKERWRARWVRFWPVFWRWLLWAVGLAVVLPLGLLLLVESSQTGHWPSGYALVGHGDLFLLSSTLLLGSLQGLFLVKDRRGSHEVVLWFAVVMAIAGFVAWTLISADLADNRRFGLPWLPTWGGLGFGTIALLVVGMSMWVQARAEPMIEGSRP